MPDHNLQSLSRRDPFFQNIDHADAVIAAQKAAAKSRDDSTPQGCEVLPAKPAAEPSPAALPRPKAQVAVEVFDGAIGNTVIELGRSGGNAVTLDLARLLAGRFLIQGSTGAGKSWVLRYMIEQAYRHSTVVIVDPEGEFSNLAEHIGATTVKGTDIPLEGLTELGLKVRAHRLHLYLDLSDMTADERVEKGAALFTGLISAPREHWQNTVLLFVDEAHLFAPTIATTARDAQTKRQGVAVLSDLCSRGRKRGIAPVLATQRISKLPTSVISELHNRLLGLTLVDSDIRRAKELLSYTYEQADVLRRVSAGSFYALGPAFGPIPKLIQINPSQTRHLGNTPSLMPPAALSREEAKSILDLDRLTEMPRPQTRKNGAVQGTHALDSLLLDPRAATAVAILSALIPISPNATGIDDIVQKFKRDPEEINAALDLLHSVGSVETSPRGNKRIVRLSARLRAKITQTPVVGLA